MDQVIYDLNRLLNKWLQDNGFDCYVLYTDNFEYDYLNGVINYTLFDETEEDQLFLTICKSIYDTEYDDFIISFLHELGHHVTKEIITLKDIQKQEELKDNITNIDNKLAYFVSFSEWEATSWACNYIKNNKEKVEQLTRLVEDSRVEFYNKMKEDINNDYDEKDE